MPSHPGPDVVRIGRIIKPHGLRGDVVVELTTDREERLAAGSRVVAVPTAPVDPDGDDRPGGGRRSDENLVVERASRQRQGTERRWARWIVGFAGFHGIEVAETWRDAELWAEPLDDPDALWVDDLVGAEVVVAGSGDRVGSCVAVVANPAADLLELDTGALVPVTFVVSSTAGQVVVDPPDGLFDL